MVEREDLPPPVHTAFAQVFTGSNTSYQSMIDDATCHKQDLAGHILSNKTDRTNANLLKDLIKDAGRERCESVASEISS